MLWGVSLGIRPYGRECIEMIAVIINNSSVGLHYLTKYIFKEYNKKPSVIDPRSLRWRYKNNPNVYTVEYAGERKWIYTISKTQPGGVFGERIPAVR